jgi:hypothetical protein
MNKLAFASTFAFAALAFTAPARSETVNCTAITSLPAVITVQGIYCFKADQTTAMLSGNAIDIQTNNVVLDLNGFKLGGLAAGLGTNAIGIHAVDRLNITIKNGTVRGFLTGIQITTSGSSQGHVVEDIRADQNTSIGIDVEGSGNIVRNNQVVATGGTTVYGVNARAYGVVVAGSGARVLNNDVTEVAAQGTSNAFGIFLNAANNSVVAGNRVGDLTSPSGNRLGIYLNASADLIASDNRLPGVQYGILFDGGATGTYMNNVVRGATTPYQGGTAAGATNY